MIGMSAYGDPDIDVCDYMDYYAVEWWLRNGANKTELEKVIEVALQVLARGDI